MVLFPDGSSCAVTGRSCWRRPYCTKHICTVLVLSCESGYVVGDPPCSQKSEMVQQTFIAANLKNNWQFKFHGEFRPVPENVHIKTCVKSAVTTLRI